MAYFENGTAAEALDRQCESCPLGAYQCPVYMVNSLYNFDQMLEGKEELRDCLLFLVDDTGRCKVRQLVEASCEKSEDRRKTLHQYAFVLKQFEKRVVAV